MEKNSTYICLFIYVRLPKSCGVNQSKKKLSQKTHKFSDDLFKMPSNSINSINKKVFMLFESFGLCLFHFQSIKTKNERKKNTVNLFYNPQPNHINVVVVSVDDRLYTFCV